MKSDRKLEAHETDKANQIQFFKFIEHHSFCTFLTYNNNGLFLSHINLIKEGGVFFGHLSAANPQAKQLKSNSTVLALFKDDHSPDPNKKAIHLYGKISVITDEDQLAGMLDKLISKYEKERINPWSARWDDPKFKTQLKGIVGFYVTPTKIEEATNILHEPGTGVAADLLCHRNVAVPVEVEKRHPFKITPVYTPHYFAEHNPETLDVFIKRNPACSIVTYSESGFLQVYHADLVIAERVGSKVLLAAKLIVSNKQFSSKAGDQLNAVAIFNGPHTYISPTWYKTAHSVPTWNYVTVHAHGTLKVTRLEALKNDLVLDVEFDVIRMDGKYKLNQNRTREDRQSVIANLTESACPADQQVGKMMKKFSSSL